MKVQTRKRWIKSVIETAQQDTPPMPWQRGTPRAAFVAKRQTSTLKAKSA